MGPIHQIKEETKRPSDESRACLQGMAKLVRLARLRLRRKWAKGRMMNRPIPAISTEGRIFVAQHTRDLALRARARRNSASCKARSTNGIPERLATQLN
jgi:hypothetical protein